MPRWTHWSSYWSHCRDRQCFTFASKCLRTSQRDSRPSTAQGRREHPWRDVPARHAFRAVMYVSTRRLPFRPTTRPNSSRENADHSMTEGIAISENHDSAVFATKALAAAPRRKLAKRLILCYLKDLELNASRGKTVRDSFYLSASTVRSLSSRFHPDSRRRRCGRRAWWFEPTRGRRSAGHAPSGRRSTSMP